MSRAATRDQLRGGRLLLRAAVLTLALAGWFAGAALAQQPTHVTGQVQDAGTSKPLASVRVAVVHTLISTLTDAKGNYALDVPAGRDSLSFRFIGYKPVTRGVAAVVNVSMEARPVELEAVVVTALGVERESRDLPYAAQTVSGNRLTLTPSQNVISQLQGNVAGVQVTNASGPFGSARIVVRGAGSIRGQNQPLIVVDGIPIDNTAASNDGYGGGSMGGYDVGNAAGDINADNIESINVLKGPNAAALFGSRAANGAVVITTKNGRGAAGEGGFDLSASFSTVFERPLRLPDYQNQYGQGFAGEFDFVNGKGGGKNDGADESWGPRLDGRTTGCMFQRDAQQNLVLDANGKPVYDTSQPCRQFFGVGPWAAHPDNVSGFWNTGLIVKANIAVARSSERSHVRLSAGRTDEGGMYPNNTNRRTDVSLAGGAQISDRWSTEASINYINDDYQNQPAQAYNDTDPMQGFIWFGRQVDTRFLKDHLYRDPNDPLTQAILAGNKATLRPDAPIQYSWNYNYHPNVYWQATVKTTDFARNRGLGQASVTYKLTDWLSVMGRTGRDWFQNHFRANYPVNNIDPRPLGGLLDVGETHSETNSEFLVTADRPLPANLHLTVNAGGGARQNRFESNSGDVGQLVIPGVYTLQNSAGTPTTSLYQQEKKVNSLYGSASLNYRGWLNLDLTGRNDWSSTLPKGKNSFFYPSIGAAFVLSDALGVQSRVLSYAKLRASWARVGNDTDPYQLATVYGNGTAWGGQPSFAAPDQLSNASLKPEETHGEEIGTDLGMFNNKLLLNATLYQKSTKNQILPVSISSATGYTSALVNSGEVRNRGVEVAATITPVDTRDFRWSVTANWAKNTNKVLSLYSGVQRIVVGSYWNVNVTADVGQPYGNLVGYKWKRDDQGRIVVDDTGLPIRDATQTVLGNYNPDWFGGITNAFTYRNLRLSVALDGQMGGNVYSVTKWFGQYSGVLAATLKGREKDWCDPGYVVPNSVKEDGSPNTTTVCPEDYWHNTFYAQEDGIIDASYLKLREARLAYRLPGSVARHLGFTDATVALIGRNLLLWAKQPTIDPETTFDTGNRQGVENGQLPTARSIGFSVSVRP